MQLVLIKPAATSGEPREPDQCRCDANNERGHDESRWAHGLRHHRTSPVTRRRVLPSHKWPHLSDHSIPFEERSWSFSVSCLWPPSFQLRISNPKPLKTTFSKE